MKKDIILAGVGGQGILSIASCIGIAAVEKNMYLKQAEVHGMSQRGGDVQSHLRLSSNEIASDLIAEGKGKFPGNMHFQFVIIVQFHQFLRQFSRRDLHTGAQGKL